MNVPVISFNNGEVTQKIDCRIDTQKFSGSCRRLKNMLPLIYGCAERRPGLKYIIEAVSVFKVLSYILSYENEEVCNDNEVVFTAIHPASSDFICYENTILCYENMPITDSKDVFSSGMVCYENDVLFYENNVLSYGV